ncbi:MAG TPA: hypothetical protein VGE15_06560, partial [Sphingobacteriaceae bacterium]
LIYIENFCGIDCGGGSWRFLRRISNGNWKPIGSLNLWMSYAVPSSKKLYLFDQTLIHDPFSVTSFNKDIILSQPVP